MCDLCSFCFGGCTSATTQRVSRRPFSAGGRSRLPTLSQALSFFAVYCPPTRSADSVLTRSPQLNHLHGGLQDCCYSQVAFEEQHLPPLLPTALSYSNASHCSYSSTRSQHWHERHILCSVCSNRFRGGSRLYRLGLPLAQVAEVSSTTVFYTLQLHRRRSKLQHASKIRPALPSTSCCPRFTKMSFPGRPPL